MAGVAERSVAASGNSHTYTQSNERRGHSRHRQDARCPPKKRAKYVLGAGVGWGGEVGTKVSAGSRKLCRKQGCLPDE